MTQDEIIEMAKQAGFFINDKLTITSPFIEDICISPMLTEFAKLVAAKEREKLKNVAIFDRWYQELDAAVLAEREACAKLCDDIDAEYEGEDVLATWCSKAIRARGET